MFTHAVGRWFTTCMTMMVTLTIVAPLAAETFQPGEAIEYKESGDRWERGVFVRELPGGKQVLIRQKPSQFFPEGSESAYALADVRKPQANVKPANPPATPTVPGGNVIGNTVVSEGDLDKDGEGLLSKEDILAYAKQLFGEGDAFQNPRRDELLAQIRDHIKTRGTSFTADDDFNRRMDAQGTNSVHISFAVGMNQGSPPKLDDYLGTWLLRTSNRGSHSVQPDGSSQVVITTTDAQFESGKLTINKDGTYVWQPFRNDPPEKWLRGSWREVKPDEMNVWEGGPAIWLEKAKQGYDCMVRMNREPGWPNWIDVGMGKARTPVEYGRKE